MKLIRQVTLHYQQGKSDKVYEVDLCEVGDDQFVVNFRYGRRGAALRDGTKTVAPVRREAAEQIFARLVESKLEFGYRHAEASAPMNQDASQPAESPANAARRQAILARLADGGDDGERWKLSRAVWRAGEMRIREAEALLPGLIGSGDWMLDYSIAWSLGQCGSAPSLPRLAELQSDAKQPYPVRRIAAQAVLLLSGEAQRAQIVERYISQLPQPLAELATGSAAEFEAALAEYLDNADYRGFTVLDILYLIDNETVRPALLAWLRTAPLKPNHFKYVRHIFKSAEMRRDAEVFGLIAYRFETTGAMFRMPDSWSPRHREIKLSLNKPDAEFAYSGNTRGYLRRRIWWTLKRLGELEEGDYVKMAVGVLLPFTDDDALPVRTNYGYDWNARRNVTLYYDRYWAYSALNHILYANSPRYVAYGNVYRCQPPYEPGQPPPAEREEAFPELWSRHPEGLLHLLDDSRCEIVHEFAARALRTCRDFIRDMDVEAVLMLLRAPYDVTVELGFDIAVERYDPANPNRELAIGMANCRVDRARAQAHRWMESRRDFFFAEIEDGVALIASPYADTRLFARDSLRILGLNESRSQALVGRLTALLRSLEEGQGELAKDVAETMLSVFGVQLRRIGAEVIRDLLQSPLPEVQRFAGELVLGHATLAAQPPVDVIRALLNAGEASVREIGVRIITRLPDDVLKRNVNLLLALATNEHEDIRETVRPALKRLAETDVYFGRQIAARLVESLLVPGAPEGVPTSTARILREDLRPLMSEIPTAMVWKLLQSRSTPAQEVGGLLLATHVDPADLKVREIVRLGNHEILSVRQACWKMFEGDARRMRENLPFSVRLLDAKWDDTREFARRWFRANLAQDDWTPEILVSVCDTVRPDVQQFGRELITSYFQEEHGPQYMLKLSEHPSADLQLFVTNYLERYAADDPERIEKLAPFFIAILSRVNKAGVAKRRVFAFLEREAVKSEEAARVIGDVLARQSATMAIGDKAAATEAMVKIHAAWPAVPLPIVVQPVEVRGAV